MQSKNGKTINKLDGFSIVKSNAVAITKNGSNANIIANFNFAMKALEKKTILKLTQKSS